MSGIQRVGPYEFIKMRDSLLWVEHTFRAFEEVLSCRNAFHAFDLKELEPILSRVVGTFEKFRNFASDLGIDPFSVEYEYGLKSERRTEIDSWRAGGEIEEKYQKVLGIWKKIKKINTEREKLYDELQELTRSSGNADKIDKVNNEWLKLGDHLDELWEEDFWSRWGDFLGGVICFSERAREELENLDLFKDLFKKSPSTIHPEREAPKHILDRDLLGYIAEHGGEISIPEASKALGVSQSEVRRALGRLKRAKKVAEE